MTMRLDPQALQKLQQNIGIKADDVDCVNREYVRHDMLWSLVDMLDVLRCTAVH